MALITTNINIFLTCQICQVMDKQELLKSVGKRIQDIRVSKGLTQVDLVGKIDGDIDTTNISRIESANANPNDRVLPIQLLNTNINPIILINTT